MRKILTFFAAMLITGSILAGGLVTNNNQSAMFTRLQNRNASTDIDAVFYNPAGLTKLGNGFFASVNNQTIFQTKTVGDNYPFLSGTKPREYIGKVKAPIYPGVYVAYNTGKLSFSAGFNPIGGGGGATYDKGLPSFESKIAELVPLLSSQGIPTTQYSGDIFFEGSSIYLGFQGNVAYKINDKFSVALGGRFVSAKNAYQGYLKNISINPNRIAFGAQYNGSNMVSAPEFFTAASTALAPLSASAAALATGITIIPASTPLTALPALTQAQINGVLALAGKTAGTTVGSALTELTIVAKLSATMGGYSTQTSDTYVDAEQTGMAFTPILSANFSPTENLNIAVKYEFKTNLDLTTNVLDGKNGGGIYIQDSVSIADLPAILFVGAEYRPTEKLMLSGSFNYYWDKKVDYDGQSDVTLNKIDKNFLEYGLGAEYSLNEKLRVSAGWLATSTSANMNYQSDITYSTNTNSFGGGFGYRISKMIDLNIGGQYTFYKQGTRSFTRLTPITETLDKKTMIIAVGLDFYFGK